MFVAIYPIICSRYYRTWLSALTPSIIRSDGSSCRCRLLLCIELSGKKRQQQSRCARKVLLKCVRCLALKKPWDTTRRTYLHESSASLSKNALVVSAVRERRISAAIRAGARVWLSSCLLERALEGGPQLGYLDCKGRCFSRGLSVS